ncbi:TenA family protein [Oxalobacter vibrioformis]|uniref:Aminopyrimidine aminohydrolase n=1 Tax=Oxalobacter vibrioformis TaxID=933080 RepID=A0A9E9LXS1_9BURK|nr:TenA family protein [Oxalobacter vibrioformis]WAW09427.1 TenA family protein [Oxalobacter vibrioformis]
MSGFFEKLKAESEPSWSDAVTHRFVNELCAGTVDDSVMGRYLIQDHRFINNFLGLLGAAVNYADKFESRIVLGRFIGMISSDENDYFLRSFKALGITEDARLAPSDSAPTKGLKNIMLEAAKSGSYAAAISVLSVAESVYLDWGLRAPKPYPENFIYTEWITLHNNDYFIGFVNFLQRELDRVGPANADICRDFFMRTVQLEKAFFDDAYA